MTLLGKVKSTLRRTFRPFQKSWAQGRGGRVSVVVLVAGLALFVTLPIATRYHVDLGWLPILGFILGIPLVLAGAAGVRLYGYELTGDASRDIKAQEERHRPR